MRLVDAHCHLVCPEFAGREAEVIAEARENGIARLISNAVRPADWDANLSLAAVHPEVAFAWGVHPWFVAECHTNALGRLGEAPGAGACAIGEIGLDAKVETPDFGLQIEFFEQQLKLANEVNLPIVVHCRGAFGPLLGSLHHVGAPRAGGIVHAYSGSLQDAEKLRELGFSFSMGRSLTYRNSKKRAALVTSLYPDALLLETDSPDMPPVEVEEKVNRPANLRYVLRAAAETLGVSAEEVAAVTARNASALFKLGLEA